MNESGTENNGRYGDTPIETAVIQQKKRGFPEPVIEYWQDTLQSLLDRYADESFDLLNPERMEIQKFIHGVDVAPDTEARYRLTALKQFYLDHPDTPPRRDLESHRTYDNILAVVYDRIWIQFEDAAEDGQYRGEQLLFRLLDARLTLEQILALTTDDTEQVDEAVHVVLDSDRERTITFKDAFFFRHLDLDAEDEPLVQMTEEEARTLFHDAAEAAGVKDLTLDGFRQLCRLQWGDDLPDWTVNAITKLSDLDIITAPVFQVDDEPVLAKLADCTDMEDVRLWKYDVMQQRVLKRNELYRIHDMTERIINTVSDEDVATVGDKLQRVVEAGPI